MGTHPKSSGAPGTGAPALVMASLALVIACAPLLEARSRRHEVTTRLANMERALADLQTSVALGMGKIVLALEHLQRREPGHVQDDVDSASDDHLLDAASAASEALSTVSSPHIGSTGSCGTLTSSPSGGHKTSASTKRKVSGSRPVIEGLRRFY
ncbi:hypothetical protein HDU82_000212 [Entophlyctis luteolus]|nr:hypothetical protein HDU82_000212 [Entophlyctis luteolus]